MPAIPTVVVHHPKNGEPITINQSDYLANMNKYKLFKVEPPSAPAPAPKPVSADPAPAPAEAETTPVAEAETETPKKSKKKIFG